MESVFEIQSQTVRDVNQARWDAFCHRPRRHTLRQTKKNKIGDVFAYNQAYNTAEELQFLGGDYRYCMLGGGNSGEFPLIAKSLKYRHVAYDYSDAEGGGRFFRIHHSQSEKLPMDDYKDLFDVPYLPVDVGSGHTLYHLTQHFAEQQRADFFRGSDWIHIDA